MLSQYSHKISAMFRMRTAYDGSVKLEGQLNGFEMVS